MSHPRSVPSVELTDDPGTQLAAALHDIAAAVRELADRAEPDPLRLLRAEDVAELLACAGSGCRWCDSASAVREALPVQPW